MSDYPATERQGRGYAIRYIKWLIHSGAVNEIGPDAFAVLVGVVTMEDEIFYQRPPNFYNEQLQRRCGIGSVPALIRARRQAVTAGLLSYEPGAKRRPGRYFVNGFANESLDNDHSFPNESLRKAKGKRKENDTLHTHTHTHTKEKRSRFIAPTVQEVRDYCLTRRNSINADQFVDHYTANGWTQGKGKPIRDWQAAVRTWERNGIHSAGTAASVSRPNESDRIPRAVPR